MDKIKNCWQSLTATGKAVVKIAVLIAVVLTAAGIANTLI